MHPSGIRSFQRRVCISTALGLAVATTGSLGNGQSQSNDSLSAAAALTQQSLLYGAPISLSPDGEWVAYTLQDPGRMPSGAEVDGFTKSGVPNPSLGCTVWVTNVATGQTLRLSGPDSTSGWAPQWSPDGHDVAFYSDQDGAARLWVWDLFTRTVRSVSTARVRPYTGIEIPRWTPDSRSVVTRIVPHVSAPPDKGAPEENVAGDTLGRVPGSTAVVYRTPDGWGGDSHATPPALTHAELFYSADLALIDVRTGGVTTLAHGFKPFDVWISPDGRRVAFTTLHGVTNAGSLGARVPVDLVVVSTLPGTVPWLHLVASTALISLLGTGVAWSPNSQSLMYAVADSTGDTFHLARCCEWQSRTVRLPDSLAKDFSTRTGAQPLRWDAAGRFLYVSGRHTIAVIDADHLDGRIVARAPLGTTLTGLLGRGREEITWRRGAHSVVVGTRDDSSKRVGFARIDLPSGRWTQLQNEEQYRGDGQFMPCDVSADARRIVYSAEGAATTPDLWSATDDWSAARRVTNISPQLSDRSYGTTRLVTWRTSAGTTVRGALLLPAGYVAGRRYPMIVYPYPHDVRSDDLYQFGLTGAGVENMQLFATRGYVVFAPDMPIRTADEMRSIADVILPGIDQVVHLGIADSAHVGVMGHSWGGYTVLALLVQTRRFGAAIMRGGFGDLPALYGDMESTGAAGHQVLAEMWLGNTLWDDQARYLENSPIFLLDRVHTPLLIIHGGAETTVPIHHADEVFVDLRRLRREVVYVRYDGENHGEESWSPPNQRDYIDRMLQWFDTHLKPVSGAIEP